MKKIALYRKSIEEILSKVINFAELNCNSEKTLQMLHKIMQIIEALEKSDYSIDDQISEDDKLIIENFISKR